MTITATRPTTAQDTTATQAPQAYSVTITLNADTLDAANNLTLDLACALAGTPTLAKARISAPTLAH